MFENRMFANLKLQEETRDDHSQVGEEAFRDALRQFASGVTVITTIGANGDVHGMTATAFSSLSLKPPLVLVAVGRKTRCHAQVAAQRQFGVSILHAGQKKLSRHFGGKPSADAYPVFDRFHGVPTIADAMVKLSCRLEETFQGGDHSIFVGRVTGVETRPGPPLLHYEGHYHVLMPDRRA